MNDPKKILDAITSLFRHHKLKLLTFILSFLVFALMIFPYEDLADLVTVQIAKATNNQLYLQFEDLNFSVIPAPGVYMDEVTLDASTLPSSLKIKSLGLYPSILSFLQFKKGLSANAEGLLSGDLQLTLSDGKKLDDGTRLQRVVVDFENFQLSPLKELAQLPMNLSGSGQLNGDLSFDPSFIQQPEGNIEIQLSNVKVPPSQVMTPFGEMPLPELAFEQVLLKGRVNNSELIIEQVQLGSAKNPLFVNMNGNLGLKFVRRGGSVRPLFTSYNFKVDLSVKDNKAGSLGLFLSFLDKFKQKTSQGQRYLFQASGRRFGPPPKLSPIRKI